MCGISKQHNKIHVTVISHVQIYTYLSLLAKNHYIHNIHIFKNNRTQHTQSSDEPTNERWIIMRDQEIKEKRMRKRRNF